MAADPAAPAPTAPTDAPTTATPGPPPAGPGPTESGAPAPAHPPPTRTSRRTLGLVAAAAVVVVVILVLALALSHGGGGGSGVGAAVSYGTAQSAAGGTATSAIYGPWTLGAAIGIVQPVGEVLPTGGSSSGCTITSTSGGAPPSTVSIPATSANLSSGLASAWFLLYYNAAGDFLFVIVVGGSTYGGVVEVGPDCSSLVSSDLGPLPATVLASPTAAEDAWTGGAATFESANPNATSLEVILLGTPSEGANYVFEYSECQFAGEGTEITSPYYMIGINATNGAVSVPGETSSEQCYS